MRLGASALWGAPLPPGNFGRPVLKGAKASVIEMETAPKLTATFLSVITRGSASALIRTKAKRPACTAFKSDSLNTSPNVWVFIYSFNLNIVKSDLRDAGVYLFIIYLFKDLYKSTAAKTIGHKSPPSFKHQPNPLL